MDERDHPRRHPCERIGVPRGILHHMTLSILEREPMSGSELMSKMEYYTDWRPSPGSVYPLLSMLEEEGLIEQAGSDPPTLKKYSLTQTGLREVERRRKSWTNIRSRYHSIQKMYWRLFQGMEEELFEANCRLFAAVEKIHPLIKEDPKTASRIGKLLRETAEEIERIKREVERTE
jgi:DNA-binding PadR family transcriptional regulator